MAKQRPRLKLEHLEDRRVFAGDWQNAVNPFDVDSSGSVLPIDALHVINDINQNGVRNLGVKPVGYSGVLCDTNGDNRLEPIDVLLVINAINQYPDPPTLSISLSQASDGNNDGVVLVPNITYQGSSVHDVTVKVERIETDSSGTQVTALQTLKAGSNGTFSIPLTLSEPINHLRFTVSDPRGRSLSTERIVRLGDAVTAWNAALLETVRETTAPSSNVPGLLIKPPPPMVARYLAMVHGAMFDAINAVSLDFNAYAYNAPAQPDANRVAAGATAAHRVASNLYNTPAEIAQWDRTLAEIMATVPDGVGKTLGIQLGIAAADAMLANRANDGSASTVNYTPSTEPGKWRPTAPGFSAATLPQWPDVTPFALTEGDEFRPVAPPSLTSSEYAAAVDQVRRLGSASGSERTADQTDIANFWADGGGTSTPPGHWNQIAIDVGLDKQQGLLLNARTMALLNYALADAGIASWDAKYAYDLWRPIDAIRLADTDGNASTVADASWTPLLNTPSFPSYSSGHSTFSGAAATVLTQLFGNMAFTTMADPGSTGLWPPSSDVSQLQSRSFSSFTQAAEEAGMSRIYGGIHYSFDNTAGQSTGQQVGQSVLSKLLTQRSNS